MGKQPDTDHYPVKKRGQKRILNPNRDAIRWLENETHDDTEISQEYYLAAGLNCVRAQGFIKADGRGHPRRMFDIFALEASSTMPVSRTPCEACDDFSRTWTCTDHPEIPWDARRSVWVRPRTPSHSQPRATPRHPTFDEERAWVPDGQGYFTLETDVRIEAERDDNA